MKNDVLYSFLYIFQVRNSNEFFLPIFKKLDNLNFYFYHKKIRIFYERGRNLQLDMTISFLNGSINVLLDYEIHLSMFSSTTFYVFLFYCLHLLTL